MFFDDGDYDVAPPRRRRFFTDRRLAVRPRRDAAGRRVVDDPDAPREESESDYVPDAEDFAPAPPKEPGPLSLKPNVRYARPVLLMFALFFAASFVHWSPGPSPFAASGEAVFQRGEWWRLVTALFTHSGMDHLAANTPLFLIFGWFLNAYFGRMAFPAAALVVGVLSNLATIALYPPTTSLVGASGMLYGMVALWLVLYVRFDRDHRVPIRLFRALAVSLVLLFPTTFHQTTSYLAHSAGFLIGIVVGGLLSLVATVREHQD